MLWRAAAWEGEEGGEMMQREQHVARLKAGQVMVLPELGDGQDGLIWGENSMPITLSW